MEGKVSLNRVSRIFFPVFSFPGNDAIGTLYDPIEYLSDFRNAGFKRWHILPITPTIIGDSPFQGPSILFGNPNLISVDRLLRVGDLNQDDCDT